VTADGDVDADVSPVTAPQTADSTTPMIARAAPNIHSTKSALIRKRIT
jgi:hypothetical protein